MTIMPPIVVKILDGICVADICTDIG
jgi:hypothetical protein